MAAPDMAPRDGAPQLACEAECLGLVSWSRHQNMGGCLYIHQAWRTKRGVLDILIICAFLSIPIRPRVIKRVIRTSQVGHDIPPHRQNTTPDLCPPTAATLSVIDSYPALSACPSTLCAMICRWSLYACRYKNPISLVFEHTSDQTYHHWAGLYKHGFQSLFPTERGWRQ